MPSVFVATKMYRGSIEADPVVICSFAMKEYFTYLLRFKDGSYYAGMTNSIERRMSEHRSKLHPDSYVSSKGEFELVHVETFREVLDAIRREKQLQSWSRKKKDALVKGDEETLMKFAKKDFSK